jgi:hypothetical protein
MELFFGTDIRTKHSNNFAATFERLLESAKRVDEDDMVVDALLFGSPSGMLFRIIRFILGEEDMNPLTGLTSVRDLC